MTEIEPTAHETPATPRTYLWWAVGATALCFLPFGLVAIWFGLRTMQAADRDDLAAAARSSRIARRWLIVTAVVGLALNLLLLVIFGLMGAFSS